MCTAGAREAPMPRESHRMASEGPQGNFHGRGMRAPPLSNQGHIEAIPQVKPSRQYRGSYKVSRLRVAAAAPRARACGTRAARPGRARRRGRGSPPRDAGARRRR